MALNENNEAVKQPVTGRGGALLIWALSAVIGFGAVYFMLSTPDNARLASPAPSGPQTQSPAPRTSAAAAPAPAAKPAASPADAPTAAGNKMVAYVAKTTPEALPDIVFTNDKGEALTLASFKGKTVLLNLWATWCGPCREEMPSLDRLQKALGSDKFEVVALSLDRQGADAVRKFLADVKAQNLKLYVDPTAKQGNALKLAGMPTTILIDREGRELGRLTGPAEWDSPEAKALIAAAMK